LVRVQAKDIKTVENRETITLDGRPISLVRLSDVLGLQRRSEAQEVPNSIPALVLGTAEKRVAFAVDSVLDEQEVLVKGLGRQLARVQNIAGATTLGSGRVVPALNVPDLLKSAVTAGRRQTAAVGAVAAKSQARRQSILVAEDSITSRMLLKSILESAGYQVRVALDGADAWTALREEEFDLVVSDVEMPRMNGFELTQKVRGDKRHADLPVVLVTGLESREDRDRGIDVGANAYIVKSSFDQSNLLSVIQKLL
jgi:two-component system chemotaxis sensor kinase CheA